MKGTEALKVLRLCAITCNNLMNERMVHTKSFIEEFYHITITTYIMIDYNYY